MEDRHATAMELAADVAGDAAATPGKPGRKSAPLLLAAGVAVIAGIGAAVFGPRILHRATPAAPVNASLPAGSASATSAPYEVEAALVRRSHGGYQRLTPGSRVRPGDQLSLEFLASRSAYVYVLNEDNHGESYLLFPQPRFDRSNPIPAQSKVVLPGSVGGRENGWTVTSRGGQEHFLIVSSPRPVPEIEADLGRLPAATPDRPIQYAAVGTRTLQRLRGVGGVAPLPAPQPSKRAGTFERFESLAGRETGVKGVWVRQITLENPDR
jgi:hypothetical protein